MYACPWCSGNTNYIALRPRATESAFAVSSQFAKILPFTHIITEPPTTYLYHHRLESSRLERSAPSTCVFTQRMLYLSENCPSERRFNVVAKSTHHPPTNAVKYYLIRSIPAHYAANSLSRRQRHKCRNLLCTTPLHYDQARFIMPPPAL